MDTKRESLGSRLGFILLSAGCAIGIGNVWKFPWMAGRHGGGLFVLVYILFLLALGVPLLGKPQQLDAAGYGQHQLIRV